jgi:1-deoxy-D-xylulose-5-phosphate reductoisomerase
VKRLAILGSTGSIGRSALAVVDAHPTRLRVVALAAGDNAPLLAAQVGRYRPEVVAMATSEGVDRLRAACGSDVRALMTGGSEGLIAVATHPSVDVVICASSGTAGLEAVLAAIAAGKTIALANKEVLVMAGALVTAAARRYGVAILPVDSEHNAVHQCVHGRSTSEIRRLILTASGGPFRDFTSRAAAAGESRSGSSPSDMADGPQDHHRLGDADEQGARGNRGALAVLCRGRSDRGRDSSAVDRPLHGGACGWLGHCTARCDGHADCRFSTRARTPTDGTVPVPSLDLSKAGRLEFHPPDHERFPCLGLAYRALRAEGTLAGVMNAANEVCLSRHFSMGSWGSLQFPPVIERTMNAHAG